MIPKHKNNWTIITVVSALLIMAWVIPVSAADAPTVSGAMTNTAGTTITITFNKTMADPSGKQAQFIYKIDGGADQPFSAAALNADTTKIDLTTSGTTIAYGDTVTVSYTVGTVVANDGGVLESFASQEVTNNVPAPIAPTVVGAVTNTAGTTITITFSKAMANPSGKQAQFIYKIDGGVSQPFSAAALNVDTTKIDLTTSGTTIAYGDTVTVSYTAGTVVANDGGVLASFTNHAVTNNVPIAAPIAAFSGTPTSGPNPLTVQFTDESTGNVTTYYWEFGDGNTSAVRNASHQFTTVGSYTVNLTVTGPGGSDFVTKPNYITVGESLPVAGFSGAPLSGQKPLNVTFTDASTGNISSYAWDFGDGNTSTLRNPSNLYTTAGAYTVNLTVTGPGGSDSETKVNYITVSEIPPVAGFSGLPVSGQKPLNVAFTDSSTGVVSSYSWNFGDGNTSTLRNPSNLYITAGAYTVSLTVTGPGGSDSETKVNYITVVNATSKIGVYNKDTGIWYLDLNGDGLTDTSADKVFSFGAPGWKNVTGDWNGDGKTDVGVTNGQQWYLDWNNNGAWDSADKAYSFGAPGWIPIVGDWSATGASCIGVTNGQQWYLDWNGNGAWDGWDRAYSFGAPGWTPVLGDWSATGASYIGVTNGQQWYLDWNGNGAWDSADKAYSFGAPGWIPIVGDWSATGASYIGVTNGQQWYLDWNGNGAWDGADKAYSFGAPGWTPVLGDWNGDGKSKIGIYKSGIWYLDLNGDGLYNQGVSTAYTFIGVAGWTPVVGDWNGNGPTKIGIFKNGVWYLDYNGNAMWDTGSDKVLTFGLTNPDYVPVVGDWNGDKKTEVGFYRMGFWSLDYFGTGNITETATFWAEGDTLRRPVVGDWNGDGKTEIGVYRNDNGATNLDYNGNGEWDASSDIARNFNVAYWTPVVGDWNGDKKSKIGVYKDGAWRLDYYGNGSVISSSFGLINSTPVIGDWNGDGKSKIGMYKDGVWRLDYNGNGAWDAGIDKEYSFGAANWLPVVGKWT